MEDVINLLLPALVKKHEHFLCQKHLFENFKAKFTFKTEITFLHQMIWRPMLIFQVVFVSVMVFKHNAERNMIVGVG